MSIYTTTTNTNLQGVNSSSTVVSSAAFTNSSTNTLSLGLYAGQSNVGKSNLFIGAAAGLDNYDGQNNVYVGNGAGITNISGSNCIVLGNSASTLCSGSITIGTNIQNNGNNSIIINNKLNQTYNKSDYVNIADVFLSTLSNATIQKDLVVTGNLVVLGNTVQKNNILSPTIDSTNINSIMTQVVNTWPNINSITNLQMPNNNIVTFNGPNGLDWKQYVDNNNELVFQCTSGSSNTTVKMRNTFTESLLNFTGSHRCICLDTVTIGQIVVSTGKYTDLNNSTKISIDEAIPIVKLCNNKMDPRVFGIVGGIDTNKSNNHFDIGNISFYKDTGPRIIVQSHGEGAIIVSNVNGNLKNGDYLTSDGYGYGMRQGSTSRHNYTVAKITCDCNFKKAQTIVVKGKKIKIQMVGCLY
jgi:hypothetical protein